MSWSPRPFISRGELFTRDQTRLHAFQNQAQPGTQDPCRRCCSLGFGGEQAPYTRGSQAQPRIAELQEPGSIPPSSCRCPQGRPCAPEALLTAESEPGSWSLGPQSNSLSSISKMKTDYRWTDWSGEGERYPTGNVPALPELAKA